MNDQHQFIVTSPVKKVFKKAKVSDEQRDTLYEDILNGLGDLVKNTGGIRKVRCAAGEKGKRGSVRVAIAHYPAKGRTYLLAARRKTEQDFTQTEYKALKAMKAILDAEMKKLK